MCSAQFRLQDQLRFMSMEHIFLKRDIRPAWIQLKWHEMTIHDRIETCWNMFMRNYHSIHEEILKDPRSFGKLRGAGTLASGGCQDRKSMLIKINTIYIYIFIKYHIYVYIYIYMPNNHRLNRLRTSFDCCPIHVSLLAWLVLLFLLS